MDKKLFDAFVKVAYENTGIELKPGRQAMLIARLTKRLASLKLQGAAEYLEVICSADGKDELQLFVNAITTNTTHFFRENKHFDVFGESLKRWREEGRHRLRIWCAASSTGEEAYSLAITVLETLGTRAGDIRILATDINSSALATAQLGHYGADRLKDLNGDVRDKYFQATGQEGVMTPVSRVKDLVTFASMNLIERPYPMKGPLDAVFCRNVMIYFDPKTRLAVCSEVARLLREDGLLFIGHSESLTGLGVEGFRRLGPSCYARCAEPDSQQSGFKMTG